MLVGKVISHFKILSRLGGGGMGVVYDAEDVDLKRNVALKFLPPHLSADEEANKRFMQEAQAASALNHPNVCTIHEIGRTDDHQLFIAMARYEGVTLKKLIAEGPLPADRAIDITRQIADGLSAAHERDIVHRDIKPANILITNRNRAVILDFGLAKLLGEIDITTSGSTMGTAAYMSPEQVRGDPVDSRTDQWSLAVLTYEMLAGERPFKGEYEHAITYSILNEPAPELPVTLPEPIRQAVSKALSKDPKERFDSVRDFAGALDTSSPPVAAQSHGRVAFLSHLSSRPGQQSARWWLGAAVLLVVIITSLLLVTKRDTGSSYAGDRHAVAVMPFGVAGDEDLAYLSEGMVDMISTVLDGVGGIRSIDPFAIISAVRKSEDEITDPNKALSIARKLSAGEFVMGNILRVGDGVRISATLYDMDAEVIARTHEELIDENGLSDGIDQLIRSLFAARLRAEGSTWQSLAASASQSIDALKAFLDGDQLFRRGQFVEAQEAYTRAVAFDSTFALAWYQLSRVVGFTDDWAQSPHLDSIALAHAQRLPERERRLIEARNKRWLGETQAAEAIYVSVIESYPDEVHAWTDLAELRYHDAAVLGRSQISSRGAFGRALDLDPDNAETLFHSIELAIRDGRSEDARMLIEYYPKDDVVRRTSFEYLLQLSESDSASIEQLCDTVAVQSSAIVNRFRSYSSTITGDLIPYELVVGKRLAERSIAPSERSRLTLRYSIALLGGRGHLREANAYLEDASRNGFHDDAVFHRVIQAVSPPYSSIPRSDLEALRRQVLTDWPREPDYLATWSGREELARAYLAALLSLRIGDDLGWKEFTGIVDQMAESEGPNSHAAGLSRTLNAVHAWSIGDFAAAIESIERIRVPFVPGEEINWLKGRQHLIKVVHAASLAAMGECNRAVDLYAHVGELDSYSLVPAYFWEAECREELGETDEAVRLYGRFASLWSTADTPLRSMVDDATGRIARLLDAAVQKL